MKFPDYVRVKNNYCICYFGRANEYLVQLRLILPRIQSIYPDIKIYIACKDELTKLVPGSLPLTKIKLLKKDFAYVFEIKCNSEVHPIEEFCNKSNINYKSICTNAETPTSICSIYSHGYYPTRSLNDKEIEYLVSYVKGKGFIPKINSDFESAGWVIGVENEYLFEGASKGIKTSLIRSGLGTDFYKKMFPCGEILSPIV